MNYILGLSIITYNSRCTAGIQKHNKKYDQMKKQRYQDYVEECNKYPGKHHPGYRGEPIDKKIRDEYNKYWGTDVSGKPNYIEDVVPFKFMNHFIEATHICF